MNKSSIAAIAVIALIGGAAISWFISSNKPIALEAGTWFGEQARALPEFELTDHNNRKLTRARFDGKWNLIFFGFTHCPDICPVSLQAMSQMMEAIDDPDVADALQVFFVSVDPDRDRPEILKTYVTYFNPDFIGATAPLADLRPLTRSLGIAHAIRGKTDGSDHRIYRKDDVKQHDFEDSSFIRTSLSRRRPDI